MNIGVILIIVITNVITNVITAGISYAAGAARSAASLVEGVKTVDQFINESLPGQSVKRASRGVLYATLMSSIGGLPTWLRNGVVERLDAFIKVAEREAEEAYNKALADKLSEVPDGEA